MVFCSLRAPHFSQDLSDDMVQKPPFYRTAIHHTSYDVVEWNLHGPSGVLLLPPHGPLFISAARIQRRAGFFPQHGESRLWVCKPILRSCKNFFGDPHFWAKNEGAFRKIT